MQSSATLKQAKIPALSFDGAGDRVGRGTMISILLLGVLIGMQHAMEADHVAAVASIAADQNLFRRAVAHGAVWGFGHTLTLMAVTGTAIIVDASLDVP